jgi:hypothetical protein
MNLSTSLIYHSSSLFQFQRFHPEVLMFVSSNGLPNISYYSACAFFFNHDFASPMEFQISYHEVLMLFVAGNAPINNFTPLVLRFCTLHLFFLSKFQTKSTEFGCRLSPLSTPLFTFLQNTT